MEKPFSYIVIAITIIVDVLWAVRKGVSPGSPPFVGAIKITYLY